MIDSLKQLKIWNTEISTGDALSEKDFYETKWMQNDMLTTTMTYLFGNQWSEEFLLHTLTIGNALYKGATSMAGIAVKTPVYEYPIMGLFTKTEMIAETLYQTGDTPGIGAQPFFLYFQTNFFKKGYTIESPNEYKCRIIKNPENLGGYWRYTVQLDTANPLAYLPITEAAAGVIWSEFWAVNNLEEGTAPGEGNRLLPGKSQNQINVIRASRTWKGNTANMQLRIKVPVDGGTTSDYLIRQDDFMFEYRWKRSKETLGWYGAFNADKNGQVLLKEFSPEGYSGDPIRVGSGVLEQIPNVFTYNKLSYTSLKNNIMDVFFSNPETMGKKVVLMTGQGGMEEFDEAMKEYINATLANNFWKSEGKIVSGQGENMEVNGYFKKVYYIGGYTIEVVHNKSFDVGLRAVKSPKHPRTGYPLESYRMVFLDTDNSDNAQNLTYCYLQGAEMINKFQPGMTPSSPNISGDVWKTLTTTDRVLSQEHRIGTCGWTLLKPNTSLHFICVAS